MKAQCMSPMSAALIFYPNTAYYAFQSALSGSLDMEGLSGEGRPVSVT